MYFAAALALFIGQYYMLFTSPDFKMQDSNPAWDLPILPSMLTGTIASVGALLPVNQAIPIIVAGLTTQGLGHVSLAMHVEQVYFSHDSVRLPVSERKASYVHRLWTACIYCIGDNRTGQTLS
jgi:tellurite resistance protein TehA-like permease